MRIRTVVVSVFSAVALFLSVQPAAAQSKPEFSIGYSFLRGLESGSESMPAGWGASVAKAMGDKISVVGDVSGNYKDGGKLHFFQAGIEAAGKGKSAAYVRLLAGLGVASGFGNSEKAFTVTPEVGVKIKGSGRVGGRIGVGFPIVRDDVDTFKYLRLFVGITVQ